MLTDAAWEGNDHIISWVAKGRAFRVHQPQKFAEIIMSRYFNQTKFKSFQRQLHIYGFQRILNGIDKGAYHHNLFRQNQQDLCLRMIRQKIKGQEGSKSPPVHLEETWGSELYPRENEVQTPSVESKSMQPTELAPLMTNSCRQSDPVLCCLHLKADAKFDCHGWDKADQVHHLQRLDKLNQINGISHRREWNADVDTGTWAVPESASQEAEENPKFDFSSPFPKSCFSAVQRHNNHFSSVTDLSESHHFERNTMCEEESDCELGMESFFAGRRFFFVEVSEDVNDVRKLHQVEAGARSA